MKAILFDLDGTLVDSSEGIIKCAKFALEHYGIEENDEGKLKAFIGPPLLYSFSKNYGFDEEKSKEAVAFYRKRYQTTGIYECSLYEGVRECIKKLREKGYLIGMASSKPEVSCKVILKHFGILDLFDEVVGATLDARIDTKEEVLIELFRRWSHIPKEEMCLIGDTIFDVNGANQTGIPCIGVTYGFGDLEELNAAGAIAFADKMEELPELIEKCFSK